MRDNARFTEVLKRNNLRITEARKAVYRILSESNKSMSVQVVFSEIQSQSELNTDRVSVYRNLLLFSEIGLVHKFQDGRYAICTHDEGDHGHKHMHIMAACGSCGVTQEIDSHSNNICKTANGLVELMDSFVAFSDITIQGTCKACV